MNAPLNWQERWASECKEWQSIADEMLNDGKHPSAYDVSQELYRRMRVRGEKRLELRPVLSSVPPPSGGSQ